MRARAQRALLILVAVLLVLGVFQTPLLAAVRSRVWGSWVVLVGYITRQEEITTAQAARERELLAENIRLKAELWDYQRLRHQLGTPGFTDFRAVPVAVVGRPLDTFQSKFLLSKGARDGLTLGAPIVIQGDVLLGFITELKEEVAVGQLLLFPETALAAVVMSPDSATMAAAGLVRGRHYTALRLTTVPRDVPLKTDQAVVTEARPGVLPFGLLIGMIRDVQSSASDVYQEATLALPYNVDQLRAAVVLLPQ